MAVSYDEGKFVVGGCGYFDDVGMLAAITSTSEITADAVPWSGLQEGRERGLGGDPRSWCMVMRYLMLGPDEAHCDGVKGHGSFIR